MPYLTIFAKYQAKKAYSVCDSFVFITENEKDHFESQVGRDAPGEVIYHPVETPRNLIFDTQKNANKKIFQIACLSNYSYFRGVDRLIEVLNCLSIENRKNVKFVIAGDMTMNKSFFSRFSWHREKRGSFPELVESKGFNNFFEFKGHVKDPEKIIKSSDLLMKLTRENNPWGRDILECLSHGVPVVSIGTYSKFVETNKTGLLQTFYDPQAIANFVVELNRNQQKQKFLFQTSKSRIKKYNFAPQQGQKLLRFWDKILAGNFKNPGLKKRVRFGAVLPALNAGGAEKVLCSFCDSMPKSKFQKRLLVLQSKNPIDIDLSDFNFIHSLNCRRVMTSFIKLWTMIFNLNLDVVFSSQVNLNIMILLISKFLPATKVIVREANMPGR